MQSGFGDGSSVVCSAVNRFRFMVLMLRRKVVDIQRCHLPHGPRSGGPSSKVAMQKLLGPIRKKNGKFVMKHLHFIMTLMMAMHFGPTETQGGTQTSLDPAVEQRVDSTLAKLTLAEKLSLLGGDEDGFSTIAIPHLGIPKLVMADGPQGVRNYGKACAFPCGAALAATWDVSLAERMGRALGLEEGLGGSIFSLGPASIFVAFRSAGEISSTWVRIPALPVAW